MIFPQATHTLRLTDQPMPIALSDLETRHRCRSIAPLEEIAIKMFETHRRHGADPSEVFATRRPAPSEPEQDNKDTVHMGESRDLEPVHPEMEWGDEWVRDVFPTKPNRPADARNSRGAAVSAQKGASDQFRGIASASP